MLKATMMLYLLLLFTASSYCQDLDFDAFVTPGPDRPYSKDPALEDLLQGPTTSTDRRTTTIEWDIAGSILDPYQDRENMSATGGNGTSCNVTSRIEYDNGFMVRIVYIPSFALLFFSTIFLIYAILKLLKPLLKIYFSVLFYAGCQLFLVACLILSLISSNLYSSTATSCSITEPLYSIGMILPGYAVLAITAIRYIFLKYPMNWRNVLRTPYQLAGFLTLVVIAIILSNLPNLGLCSYTLYSKGDLVQCRYSNTGVLCTVFYCIFILFGFAIPPIAVTILYCLIIRIIRKHRAYVLARTVTRSSGTCSSAARSTKFSRSSGSTSLVASGRGGSEELLKPSHPASEGERSEKERVTMPWSIIVITVLNLLSTLPWIPQALYPDLFYGCQPGEVVLLVDVLWTVLIVAVSLSPVAYLVTTQSVRDQLKKWLFCPCFRVQPDKQFQRLSNV